MSLAPLGSSPHEQDDDTKALSCLMQVIGSGTRPDGYTGELELSALLQAAIERSQQIVAENQAAITRLIDAVLAERHIEDPDELDLLCFEVEREPEAGATLDLGAERTRKTKQKTEHPA